MWNNSLRSYLFFYLIIFNSVFSFAQDQRVADSLAIIYSENKVNGEERLWLLNKLAFNERNDHELRLKYCEELIQLASNLNNYEYLYKGYFQKGNSRKYIGDSESAIEAFFQCAEIAIENNDLKLEGTAYMTIADVYSNLSNFDNANIYYDKSIKILRKKNDSVLLASVLLNSGDAYFKNKQYSEALTNFEESGLIFKAIDYSIGIAYNKGNVGMVYAEIGNDQLAESNINEAILVLEETKDYSPIITYLLYMSDIYLRKKNLGKAILYANRGYELAEKYALKKGIRDASLKLSELNKSNGNFEASNIYLTKYYTFRDSIINIETVENIADLRTNYEVSQKQIEVDLLDQKRQKQRITIIAIVTALILITILVIGLLRRNLFIKKTSSIIQKERDLSNKLLRNILPEETAKELLKNGKVKPRKINQASVLFTDFKGFTKKSENLSPEQLVESVNFYYSEFDKIVQKYGLEKIKTIGDAYMVAGGLPFPTEDHAIKIVEAALDISKFVKETKLDDSDKITHFDIRIGVNSGPVVAGVVGIKKFAYDIWGDTVNVASRMESNSEPGKINVSESTYEFIKHKFDCTYRGEIETKNRGKLKMYFVEGVKADIEG
ncbi:adenylate/guanylate cyclase domain-containing protein [Lutimonas halocynthiae]|uniref:adenylate/guanylate cyclase domain-containing protein n=1 Tax=Lutimonas halocynthiae TaxID=1446477 RepID=UPI0025B5F935|nr:adenylate/guanylate cyclase domain-containing protein [Lutimonas halocynthiae]MDN3642867.1 adenylate/guanylate cyclase domain-containing protein [Lutimonas halocynthiae]